MKTILKKSNTFIITIIITLILNINLFSQSKKKDEIITNPISHKNEIQLQEKIKAKDNTGNNNLPLVPVPAGIYTLGITAPFNVPATSSIQGAIDYLEINGISGTGDVTIQLQMLSYIVSYVTIHSISGAGPGSRIIFLGMGLGADFTATGGTQTNDYVVCLAGADYITFDNINVSDFGTNSSNQNEYGYLITNNGVTDGAQHNIIQNCKITLGGGGTIPGYSHGVLQSTIAGATQTNNNNKYENLQIENSDRGIGIFGIAGALPPFEENVKISGCILGQTGIIGNNLPGTQGSAIGIIASNCTNVEISNNKIYKVTSSDPATTSSIIGLSAQNCSGNVFNNLVTNITNGNTTNFGTKSIGIQASGISPFSLKVYNNSVSGIRKLYTGAGNSTVSVVGIRSTQHGGEGVIEYYHNTIYIAEGLSAYSSSAFQSFGGGVKFKVINNIFYNNTPASSPAVSLAINDENLFYNLYEGNFNDLWVFSGNTIGRKGFTGSSNLQGWRTVSVQDFASISKLVNFVNTSTGDLHLSGTSITDAALIGSDITGILQDIDGDPRLNNTMGVDEVNLDQGYFGKLLLAVNFQCPYVQEIIVEIRAASNPNVLVESRAGLGGLGDIYTFYLGNIVNGVPYYIVVRHKNSIETWSVRNGEIFVFGTRAYEFTAPFSAYPSLPFPPNEFLDVTVNKWTIYGGDLNQDGIVDGDDIIAVENDWENGGVPTIYPTDLDCDGKVNIHDIYFLSRNSNIGSMIMRP